MRFPPDTDPGLLDWYKKEFVRNRPEVFGADVGILNQLAHPGHFGFQRGRKLLGRNAASSIPTYEPVS